MTDLFEIIKGGDLSALINFIKDHPDKVNEISDKKLSLFQTLLDLGYTKTAEEIMHFPEFELNHQDHNPLFSAVVRGCIDIAFKLLEMGASPNHQSKSGASTFLVCIENEYFDLASLMVSKGAEVDIRNTHGWTPLIWASMKGRQKAVDFLIEHGANIHACNNDGWNAVTGAYFKKRNNIVKQLIDQGAVFGAKYAEAALLSAYENGYIDVVNCLLDESQTNPNVADKNNVSLLAKAVDKGDWDVVKKLVEKGADANVFDSTGLPLLALLAKNGHIEMMTLFLENNGHIHLASETGEATIHCAANFNQLETVHFLIEQGADVNAQTHEGDTPMMMAARKGYVDMVRLLLEHNANPEITSNSGSTVYEISQGNEPSEKYDYKCYSHLKEIEELLFENQADVDD